MENTQLARLKDNSERAKQLVIVFYAYMGFLVIALISGIMELSLLYDFRDGVPIDPIEADNNDLRQGVIGIVQMGGYIVTIIFFLNWFRRAYGNINRIGIQTKFSEKMSIWAFFIPFISLYRPYQIMKEIWVQIQVKIRDLSPGYFVERSSTLMSIWWAFFLFNNFLGNLAFRLARRADTVEQLITSSQLYFISDLLQVLEAYLVILLIQKISGLEIKLKSVLQIESIST